MVNVKSKPGFRTLNITAPVPYAVALTELAGALGASSSGLIKAALEVAAHRLAEQAEHQDAQAAAATFLQASAAITKRDTWASLPGIELPTTTVEAA